MKPLREVYYTWRRAFCAAFHNKHLQVAFDLRAGITNDKRTDIILCSKCSFAIAPLPSDWKKMFPPWFGQTYQEVKPTPKQVLDMQGANL